MEPAARLRDLGWARLGMGVGALAVIFWVYLWVWGGGPHWDRFGVDFLLYRQSALDWLAGRSVYLPRQLSGPYAIAGGERLYPPITLLLFLPFVCLPAWLWWFIPLFTTAYGLWRLDLAAWTWPWLLLLAATLMPSYLTGNPGIWMCAFIVLGLTWSGPAALVLLKPTLAPFALLGIRRRPWWIVVAALAVASLFFGSLWLDWWRAAVINPTNGGLLYNANSYPWAVLVLVISLGRNGRTLRTAVLELKNALPTPGRIGRATAHNGRNRNDGPSDSTDG